MGSTPLRSFITIEVQVSPGDGGNRKLNDLFGGFVAKALLG
jgi:hypothetical protein